MNLLHLDSSALGAHSVTREITAAAVERWAADAAPVRIVRRDLDAAPLPHLSAATLAGGDAVAESAAVLDEFLAADVVVIGAPMYNFGVPSTLKAWLDRISVAGKTFRYTAEGPEGLVHGKTVVIAVAAGGAHAGQPTDFVEPYLRQLFGFLGVRDVHVVRADGVAMSAEHRREAIERAVAALPAPLRHAA
ncbi:FMN-dependent NADH-azoreductase [Cognatilysobacter segetis]|uniref:FMN-dependent NADH-azoreductase n=1 Tax=Cognatilysobacter segetis TaxID=2492394 RepID=UPI00105F1D9D|nr:NAD(P)H-dependent oxidoreductase [Lysobacter segetis]